MLHSQQVRCHCQRYSKERARLRGWEELWAKGGMCALSDRLTGRASQEHGGYRRLSDLVCWSEKIFAIDSLQRRGCCTVKVFSDPRLQINKVTWTGRASDWRSAFPVISRLDRHDCQLESSFRYNRNAFFLKTFLKVFNIQGRNYRGVQDNAFSSCASVLRERLIVRFPAQEPKVRATEAQVTDSRRPVILFPFYKYHFPFSFVGEKAFLSRWPPFYQLTVASSLPLEVGYLLLWAPAPLGDSCPAVSSDFAALAGGAECMSFCSTILNQSLHWLYLQTVGRKVYIVWFLQVFILLSNSNSGSFWQTIRLDKVFRFPNYYDTMNIGNFSNFDP